MLWADLFTGDEARMARKSKKPAKLTLHLRLDAEIHDRLVKAAEENNLSLQKEVIERLEKTFADDDQLRIEIKAHNARLERLEEMWQREQKAANEADTTRTPTLGSLGKRPKHGVS